MTSNFPFRKLWRKQTNHLIYVFVLCFFFFFSVLSGKFKILSDNYEIIPINSEVLDKKNGLFNVDVTNYLKNVDWERSGFNRQIEFSDFVKCKVTGYVSNLNLKYLSKGKKKKMGKIEQIDSDSYRHLEDEYQNLVTCEDLEYSNILEYQVEKKKLSLDLHWVRNILISRDDNIAKYFKREEEQGWTEQDIIKKRWYAFGTAAVWLKEEDCYVTYTRVIYSRFENRARSYISVTVAQAFDKNWNELKGKRIPYRDYSFSSSAKKELENLKSHLSISICNRIPKGDISYDNCISKTNKNTLEIQKKIDQILDKYSMTYPAVLDILFKMREKWNGPEDAHVILKSDTQGEEPVVIFSMATSKGRKVHALMPHRKFESLVEFNIDDFTMKKEEKNWSPFFHPGTIKSTNDFPGFIHFVYDYSPLEVLRCSLFTGHCNFVFQAH